MGHVAQCWDRTLATMRIACPLVASGALALAVIAILTDNPICAAIDGALFGINCVLAHVQWVIFKPWKEMQ